MRSRPPDGGLPCRTAASVCPVATPAVRSSRRTSSIRPPVTRSNSVMRWRARPLGSSQVKPNGFKGLSKVVALEGGPHGVTSNCVNPGYVRTPLVDRQIADQARTHHISEADVLDSVLLESAALKRLVEPEEVAEAVAFLCGPQAAAMTGTDLVIDGGWTAR